MSVVYLEGPERDAALAEMDAITKAQRDFLRKAGATSFEAAVLVDPPVSDVRED